MSKNSENRFSNNHFFYFNYRGRCYIIQITPKVTFKNFQRGELMILNRFKSNWKIKIHFDWLKKYIKNQSYPICIEVDPSNTCPLNCSYCCWAKMRKQTPIMIKREKLLKLVKEISDLKVKSIIWTGGGEPLTNPCTIEAIDYAKKLGIDNGMFTNAVLLDKLKTDHLVKNLNWIRFHVGGSTPELYAKNHGTNSKIFNLVCKNIKYVATKKINCGIGVAINQANFDNIKRMPELALKLGVEYFQGKLDFEQIDKKEYVDWWFSVVVPYFKKIEKKMGNKLKIHIFNDPIVTKTKTTYCHAHHVITAITADGRVAFCKMRRDQKMTSIGNIYKKGLKEIFDSKKHKKIARCINPKTCKILASFCPYRTTNEVIDELVQLNKSYNIKHSNFF